MIVKCVNTIKSGGKYFSPGKLLELPDAEAEQLVKIRAVEYLPISGETEAGETEAGETEAGETEAGETEAGETVSPSDDVDAVSREESVYELTQVKGVSGGIAAAMFDAGILGVESLQKITADELYSMGINGIGRAKAKTIIDDAAEFNFGE